MSASHSRMRPASTRPSCRRVSSRRLGLVLLALLPLLHAGCGKKYAGASEKSYAIATSLVNVCSREQVAGLDSVSALIDESVADGSLSSGEADYLRDIVATARDGEWDEAEQVARQVLSDQVTEQ